MVLLAKVSVSCIWKPNRFDQRTDKYRIPILPKNPAIVIALVTVSIAQRTDRSTINQILVDLYTFVTRPALNLTISAFLQYTGCYALHTGAVTPPPHITFTTPHPRSSLQEAVFQWEG